jgi:hypothetical protein
MSFDLKISQGDLVIGADGDLAKVEGSDKLIQDILKMAMTPLGGNPFFTWYGCPLGKTLIGNVFDTKFIVSLATSQFKASMDNLKSLQDVQAQSSQPITAEEHIAAVQEVNITRNQVDPRFFRVWVSVVTKQFTRIQTNFNVTL